MPKKEEDNKVEIRIVIKKDDSINITFPQDWSMKQLFDTFELVKNFILANVCFKKQN